MWPHRHQPLTRALFSFQNLRKVYEDFLQLVYLKLPSTTPFPWKNNFTNVYILIYYNNYNIIQSEWLCNQRLPYQLESHLSVRIHIGFIIISCTINILIWIVLYNIRRKCPPSDDQLGINIKYNIVVDDRSSTFALRHFVVMIKGV